MAQGDRPQLLAQAKNLLDTQSTDPRALLQKAKQLYVAGEPIVSRRLGQAAADAASAEAKEYLSHQALTAKH
jgi:hypothetical protein